MNIACTRWLILCSVVSFPLILNYILTNKSKGLARSSENSNKISSVTSNARINAAVITFANGFAQDGHVELFRLGSL